MKGRISSPGVVAVVQYSYFMLTRLLDRSGKNQILLRTKYNIPQ